MAKYRYIGDQQSVSVGIAGALFIKGVVNEVPDERLVAEIKDNPLFEEVTVDVLPAVPAGIMHAPRQGALHPDPRVDRFMRDELMGGKNKGKTLEHEGVDGLGNINRADQYSANTEALSGEAKDVTELSSDSGGEEVATPPASKPAGKRKTAE